LEDVQRPVVARSLKPTRNQTDGDGSRTDPWLTPTADGAPMSSETERLTATLAYERSLLERVEALLASVGRSDEPDHVPSPLVVATLWLAELLHADPRDVWLALGCTPTAVPPDARSLTRTDPTDGPRPG
jgi:hypothetical protein